ncbi:DNA mismatch repair endonuclease MutL [Clostridium sp. NSJ-49]|uniref:DNA mismatch repair endonuclease MutL n=1 Tax=Clostridium TaxID=1485 RepID=UPI00164B9B37|nr:MULTISPECIES: DNA mismatch repair endonuclease MutL [unclassified Clostridium]MBC5626715.1 DNA mismatch repair endonuclease MutL [Clostridium sp. NSJ-49]MCD2500986.1 DNA mismatch repair endonuclease MutL [Clostridium sp. NSJ-145]MDU6339721.1 DNA mismatch repair endonuclease MutL [Clostridium sp.]
MKRINILDQHTANKIAAGEVVERPSSVVKELVENSIDANSKNITIEINEGGLSLIKIIDDGSGINRDDIEIAFLPHATSKISKVEDIYNISTLGFRGEALASIASISKISLKSKTNDADNGSEIILEAGKKVSLQEVGMNNGTIMEVKDLFFNVPARKKFLKSISRESSLINDIVTRIALSNPEISIKLFNNDKKVINTYGTGNLKDVIRTIYGKNVYDNILYFEGSRGDISVHGYIGKEEIAKGSRNHQSIFVNNRYIKNKTIIAAVENAFKSFSVINKFPFVVIFIDLPPELVDVNIHPTKAEIKFNDERAVFKVIFDTIHSVLREDALNKFNSVKNENNKFVVEENVERIEFNISSEDEYPTKKIEPEITKDEVKKEIDIKHMYNSVDISDIEREEKLYNKLKSININNFNKSNEEDSYEINNDKNSTEVVTVNEDNICQSYNIKDDVNTKEAKFPKLRVIGQFSKMYILAEYGTDLYIVDQHAAHEKILFEKYFKDIEEGTIIVQQLLVPIILDLSLEDYAYFEENNKVFSEAGFVIDHFGGETISIKEVPYFLGKLDAKKLFMEILDNLKALGSGKTSEVKLNKIASMACRSAVKANDYLNHEEMDKLIEDLRYINDPFHCPHGRPIIIKFTEYELNKKFRRII